MSKLKQSGEQRRRILFAEDNEINQRVLTGMLQHQGYDVCVVSNGEQVLDALASRRYDLVIMDCLMPVMDGFAATRKIRASRSKDFDSKIPILAITALAAPGDREKCLAAGMNAYISKPVIAKQLYEKLQRLLNASGDPVAIPPQDPKNALADILTSMSDRLQSDCQKWRADLSRLAAEEALADLGRLAHTIRGAADVLCEAPLSRAATNLEMAARENRSEPMPQLTAALIDELRQLETTLRNPS
ncbi:MAG: response regulator [Xanthomonadales bacterium]|nr:response regulator [Xanthomonadales bacterium]